MRSAGNKSSKKSSKVAKSKNLVLDVSVEIPPTVSNEVQWIHRPSTPEEQSAAILGLHHDLDCMLAPSTGVLDRDVSTSAPALSSTELQQP